MESVDGVSVGRVNAVFGSFSEAPGLDLFHDFCASAMSVHSHDDLAPVIFISFEGTTGKFTD